MSDYHLPSEIWCMILLKLPASSILRYRSVCKTWYSLTSSPNFVSNHTTHSSNNRLLLHGREWGSNKSTVSSVDESFTENSRLRPDFLQIQSLFANNNIIGSCNGLICFSDYYSRAVILNPTLGKSFIVPFRTRFDVDDYCPFLGFGLDPKTGGFKLLRIVYKGVNGFGKVVPDVAEVFDLGKSVWRDISPDMYPWEPLLQNPNVYLNGSIHWIVVVPGGKIVLLSFDMSEEVFRETKLPEVVRSAARNSTNLMLLGGLVCVMVLERSLVADDDDDDVPDDVVLDDVFLDDDDVPDDVVQKRYSLWEMRESGVSESWTKVFTVILPFIEVLSRLLHSWENGDLVVDDGEGLTLCCPNGKVKRVLATRPVRVCAYVETLFDFGNMN